MSKRGHNFGTKRFKENSLLYISCPHRAEVADTAVCTPDCARCQNRENTHTDRHTDRQTHRQNKYCNPRACAPRVNNYYTAGMVQPKITTCTLGLATVVITLGNLASFPSYSCLVYIYDNMIMQFYF